ncbi:MAG: primosomal protein N' [Alphaproteobacteria bacterium]|nr:primosomal protein N' [Alphaproteobacteria bacterium]
MEALPYARIAVAVPVQQPFTYAVPAGLKDRLARGHAVLVPFGPRQVTGYVLDRIADPGCPPDKLKPVARLLDPEPAFDDLQLDFFRWIARYYQAGLGEVIATALPTAMKARSRTAHRATEAGVDALALGAVDGADAEVLREVIKRPGLTRRGLLRRLSDLLDADEAGRALERLVRRDQVSRTQEEAGGVGGMTRVARRLGDPEGSLGRRQAELLDALAEGEVEVAELVAAQGPYTHAALRRLEELGLVSLELRERRDAVVLGELPARRAPPTLTPAQQAAVDAILGPPKTHLLFGVTGSGKTEVYLRAAAAVLERGQQVLVLVPEIGLTPLLTGRFRARFGESVAVLHSGLTGAQRLREWRRIRAGEARVAVGARSALFAPFHDLGLLVVDEEHDDSYKQDDGVRYNARDLAVVLGRARGCPVVLGSATPSMETVFNADSGRYGRVELLERPTPRPVPEIELVDLNQEPRVDGRVPLVAAGVARALRACFAAGGQAIVLYNRRGYATFVQCPDCGGAYTCPSCGVGLVYHQKQRTLSCHYCGFHRPYASACPACGGEVEVLGRGTEQVEETLAAMFPDVPIARMDADTTAARGAHHRILRAFGDGETRLLVGTQVVAKGHDFPGVHLAVVLGVDHVLMMPDFRAAERAYSLITQLAGRAGRGDTAGRVFVQTHHPEHYVFQLLGDPRGFAAEELRHRKPLRYPPYGRLALLRTEAADRDAAVNAAWTIARRLRATADGRRVQVLGPAQAALPRLVGRWRYQLLLRGLDAGPFHRWLGDQDLAPPSGPRVRVALDVDPRSLM